MLSCWGPQRMRLYEVMFKTYLTQAFIHNQNYIPHADESQASTPATLFLLRTRPCFQMLTQHSYMSYKCLKLSICQAEFKILFSNQTLPNVFSLTQESQLSFLYSSKMETSIILWISVSHWLKFNYSPHFLSFFSRNIPHVWLLFSTVVVLLKVCPHHSLKLLQILLLQPLSNPFNSMITFLK